ncbi:hypothetical protein SADUNF_Sadunf03G0116100 [Salix dunnii]|uniref:Uncharacterized protein n=1 Tax=Salix dunnii TaxID=1413687 RepID=A0A835N4C5_9ROSI|nr:hypothetical protein SADUNF_Sadunf03G0116100 [Salix dunnii]
MPQVLPMRSSVSVGEKRLSLGDATREEITTTTGGHKRDVIDAKGLLLVAGGARWVVNDDWNISYSTVYY